MLVSLQAWVYIEHGQVFEIRDTVPQPPKLSQN